MTGSERTTPADWQRVQANVQEAARKARKARDAMEREQERFVHFAHCYQGEWIDCCKYGYDDCPAKPTPAHGKQAPAERRYTVRQMRGRWVVSRDHFDKAEPQWSLYDRQDADELAELLTALAAERQQREQAEARVKELGGS